MKDKHFLLLVLFANISTLGFIALAGWLAYLDKPYGWTIFCAVLAASSPSIATKQTKEDANKPD